MRNNLNHSIDLYFQKCHLDSEYSLLEWDFFDTVYKHFSDVNQEYLANIGTNKENLFEKFSLNYTDLNYEVAFEALKNNARTIEERTNWHNISLDYLVNFSINCSYLSAKAFCFYLPQCMKLALIGESEDNFFDYFLFRLEKKLPQDFFLLTNNQIHTIEDFLACYKN